MSEKFIKNRLTFIVLVAACSVILISMGLRQTFGLFFQVFEENLGVTRTEFDGSVTVIADSFRNSKLNAPNDVAIHKDGAIWFTDPGYGILNNYEGDRSEPELPTAVYRIDPISGTTEMKATGLSRPNGLCFSPDFNNLYLADSGSTNPRSIYIYNVSNNGTDLNEGRVFVETGKDSTDGIRCDRDGNLWASAQHGTNSIAIYNSETD